MPPSSALLMVWCIGCAVVLGQNKYPAPDAQASNTPASDAKAPDVPAPDALLLAIRDELNMPDLKPGVSLTR